MTEELVQALSLTLKENKGVDIMRISRLHPDSFKEKFICKRGPLAPIRFWKCPYPALILTLMPIGDGGEGTLDAPLLKI